jgi:hypothetical protein
MSLLKSFSESVVNRSNNRGKLNYEKLYELLEKEAPKNLNLLSSKSDEKKEVRKVYQKLIIRFAENVDKLTMVELKELHDMIIAVQGEYNSAKELYNAKTLDKEESVKKLFAKLQTAKSKNFKQVNK